MNNKDVSPESESQPGSSHELGSGAAAYSDLSSPEDFFTASKEAVDSLRLETSRLTPELQKALHDAAINIKEQITRSYGDYIQPEARDRTAHIEDRIVVMDKDHFRRFYGEWDGSGDDSHERLPGAVTFRQGDVIAFNEPSEVWNTFTSEAQNELVQQFGDEDTARRTVTNIAVYDNLAHEVAHQFQDNSLPTTFLEVATRYYQHQATSELKYGHLVSPSMDESVDLMNQLVSEYGDAVHKVYFGKALDPNTKSRIIAEVMVVASRSQALSNLSSHT